MTIYEKMVGFSKNKGASMRNIRRMVSFGRIVVGFFLVIALTSCFRPMYAESNMSAVPELKATLASIAINPPGDRVGQQISNNLSFKLTGGVAAPVSKYQLSLATSTSGETALVNGLDLTPKIDSTTVACDFTLTDAETGKVLLKAKAFGRKSYNSSLQRFATVRGQRDAENSVAEVIADQIQTRLAAFFVSHGASLGG